VDGEVLVRFELLFPQRRRGSRPDLLLPQMRAVGLDPDWQEPPYGEVDTAALALAERVTGVHLDPRMLEGPLPAAEITPLLDDPPSSFLLDREDVELAAAVDQAAPDLLRRAAATAARQAVQLARLDHDPVVMEALAAAEAGQARQVDDRSPLGWRIRTWAVEARIVARVRNDPAASLEAQRRAASLLRAAGRAAAQPLKDPSPWLGRGGSALLCARLSGRRSVRRCLPTRAPRCTPPSRGCAFCQATRGWRSVPLRSGCCGLARRAPPGAGVGAAAVGQHGRHLVPRW
jgi:Family of unknown function (DUF6461)